MDIQPTVILEETDIELASTFTRQFQDEPRFFLETNHRLIPMPPELAAIVSKVLRAMRDGGTVTIGHMPEVLTSTAASDLLGISRPTLVKKARKGEIPFHEVGSHMRFLVKDVMEYKKAQLAAQHAAVVAMMRLEDNLNINDE